MTLSRNEGDDLWGAVFAAPDDDAPRRALADWLRGQSDPAARARGEFIHLQLAPSPRRENAAAWKRENALLQKYQRAWLGALAPVIVHRGAVFERGFLDSCVIRSGAAPVGDPLWSTVRAVELDQFAGAGFLAHPVMRWLRRVNGLDLEALVRLAVLDHPMAVESIACIARAFSGEAEAVIAESSSLPSLRALELWVLAGKLPSGRLLGGALGRRLETLRLRISGYAAPLAPLLRVVRERDLPLVHLHLDFSWLETSLERGFDGRLSSLAARVVPKYVPELYRFLAELHDGDLSRARIYTGGKLTPAQRGELRHELRGRFPSLTIDFV